MTRKYFEALAVALKQQKPRPESVGVVARTNQWDADCRAVANAILDLNRAFDAVRFLRNCGVIQ